MVYRIGVEAGDPSCTILIPTKGRSMFAFDLPRMNENGVKDNFCLIRDELIFSF